MFCFGEVEGQGSTYSDICSFGLTWKSYFEISFFMDHTMVRMPLEPIPFFIRDSFVTRAHVTLAKTEETGYDFSENSKLIKTGFP